MNTHHIRGRTLTGHYDQPMPHLSISVDDTLHKRLTNLANQQRRKVSQLARILLEDGLDAADPHAPPGQIPGQTAIPMDPR